MIIKMNRLAVCTLFRYGLSIVLTTVICQTNGIDSSYRTFNQLLEQIDALEGYGPYEEQKQPFEGYLLFAEKYLSSPEIEKSNFARYIIEQLFSRYSYRDGSHRSRIYGHAHKRLMKLCKASQEGRTVLELFIKRFPHLQTYKDLID